MLHKPLLIELQFLPCLEYFCLLIKHQEIFLEGQESYLKGSYRNKAKIVTANGVQAISIPLKKGKHQQKNIKEVQISFVENWQRQHWRSLKTAYQSAPFWEDYSEEIKPLLLKYMDTLWEYNLQLLHGLINILQLDLDIKITLDFQTSPLDKLDLRHKILPKNNTWYTRDLRSIQYSQVFEDRQAFIPNASVLDLLFCKGPEASLILEDMLI